ncbi:glycosyltransferase [Flavobacterium amniphilum]|uniref:glycosyltransferase n=1 Tax=Flavobacterium amniphilum TaxID=1834035 RepID=UPI00202AC03D|nr:glycosyltransferase [Flavobacterium amniphilum]MCL9805107.1 glycosyltransferase [Flavobacterium amniphilum]
MKILFVSMPSIHVIRWIENLSESGHELFWFDVLDRGTMETSVQLHQITNWKKRKLPYFNGEHFLRKKIPFLYNIIQSKLEITVDECLTKIINEIRPDVVHSFEMQHCSYPILKTMRRFPNLKWIYSCWGSDLFFYQNSKIHLPKIKEVLHRINYLHTDCGRDHYLALCLGFKGMHSGDIPGGGGFHMEEFKPYSESFDKRRIILVKGYEHEMGRGLNVVKALKEIYTGFDDLKVVVFGAHQSVIDYIQGNKLPFQVYDRNGLKHNELLQLMGKTQVYIGNSISDGMPNTLLEAIIMGAFPIQSNPGGVTAEIIEHNHNGLLINNAEDVEEIKTLILQALNNKDMLQNAFVYNGVIAKGRLDYTVNQQKIVALYHRMEN